MRKAAIKQFLNTTDWRDARLIPLAQDASFRRYFRLQLVDRTAILMDAPPPERAVIEFARIAEHLDHLGLHAPAPLAIDNRHGLLLLSDLGDTTFTRALADGTDESHLYQIACDTLIHLHQHPKASSIDLPDYDVPTLDQETALLLDWFYPLVMAKPANEATRASYFKAWHQIYADLPCMPSTLVLRDFHIDNLMVIADTEGNEQCALLDFQDALIGSPMYDLMSLLQDARRDISPSLEQTLLDYYFERVASKRQTSLQWYWALGAQRHCKVAGIFVRLWQRDQKPHYLNHLPRVIRLLKRSLARDELQAISHWFSAHLPLDHIDWNRLNP